MTGDAMIPRVLCFMFFGGHDEIEKVTKQKGRRGIFCRLSTTLSAIEIYFLDCECKECESGRHLSFRRRYLFRKQPPPG